MWIPCLSKVRFEKGRAGIKSSDPPNLLRFMSTLIYFWSVFFSTPVHVHKARSFRFKSWSNLTCLLSFKLNQINFTFSFSVVSAVVQIYGRWWAQVSTRCGRIDSSGEKHFNRQLWRCPTLQSTASYYYSRRVLQVRQNISKKSRNGLDCGTFKNKVYIPCLSL